MTNGYITERKTFQKHMEKGISVNILSLARNRVQEYRDFAAGDKLEVSELCVVCEEMPMCRGCPFGYVGNGWCFTNAEGSCCYRDKAINYGCKESALLRAKALEESVDKWEKEKEKK